MTSLPLLTHARRGDRHVAIDVLTNELRVFRPYSEDLYREMTMLLTMDNFRCAGYSGRVIERGRRHSATRDDHCFFFTSPGWLSPRENDKLSNYVDTRSVRIWRWPRLPALLLVACLCAISQPRNRPRRSPALSFACTLGAILVVVAIGVVLQC